MASLTDVIRAYDLDFEAKVTIFADCLSGLSYLHDQKDIMHRDLNPNNIVIVSFDNPKGVIIDLDAATTDKVSTDHLQGTEMYLAPEIVDLKGWNLDRPMPPPYGKQVDVWALGLSMFTCYIGHSFSWAQFLPRDQRHLKVPMVTEQLHTELHERLIRREKGSNSADATKFLEWIRRMTEYEAAERLPALEILNRIRLVAKDRGKGSIVLKGAHKRHLEE